MSRITVVITLCALEFLLLLIFPLFIMIFCVISFLNLLLLLDEYKNNKSNQILDNDVVYILAFLNVGVFILSICAIKYPNFFFDFGMGWPP
jgi:hypothetical protein